MFLLNNFLTQSEQDRIEMKIFLLVNLNMNALLHRSTGLLSLIRRTNAVSSVNNVRKSMWNCRSRSFSASFPSVPTALPGGDWIYKGHTPTEIKVKKNERVSVEKIFKNI